MITVDLRQMSSHRLCKGDGSRSPAMQRRWLAVTGNAKAMARGHRQCKGDSAVTDHAFACIA
jgi:hypothetical protein